MSCEQKETAATVPPAESFETSIEFAKRAFALRRYEEAVEHYAAALELITKKVGDDAPEIADLYFSYGKALLENAIVQNSVLGKEQSENEENKASSSSASNNGPVLSFSGDELLEEDPAVDLFQEAEKDVAAADAAEAEAEAHDDDDDDDEPEDDFNAAWDVLDLARAIYARQQDDEEVKLKLADTYIALGDVSLETEKFDQAIKDYEEGLKLKTTLLPPSSRQLAEAHYKLSIVLDLTSGRLSDAIVHAEKALDSIERRLSDLQDALTNGSAPETVVPTTDVKGKGKAKLVEADAVSKLSKTQIEGEIKELSGLKEDLALKIEELKTSPNESITMNAAAMAAQALDRELNSSSTSSKAHSNVNDLTSIVKKKKKAPEGVGASKRKAEEDAESSNSEKKIKMDTPES